MKKINYFVFIAAMFGLAMSDETFKIQSLALDDSYLDDLKQNCASIRTLEFENPDAETVALALSACPNVTSVTVSPPRQRRAAVNLCAFASSTTLTQLTATYQRIEYSNCQVSQPFPALTSIWVEGVTASLETYAMLGSRPRLQSFVYIGDLDDDCYLPIPFSPTITNFILNGPVINEPLLDLLAALPNLQGLNVAPSRLGDLSMANFLGEMNQNAQDAVAIQSYPIDRAAVSVLQTKLQKLNTLVIRFKLESAADVDELMKVSRLTELRILVDSVQLPLDTWKIFANHPRLRIIHVPQYVGQLYSYFSSRGKQMFYMNERITPFDPSSVDNCDADVTTGEEITTTGQEIVTTGQEIVTTGQEIITTGRMRSTGQEIITTGPETMTTGQEIVTTGQEIITTGQEIITTGEVSTTGEVITTEEEPAATTGEFSNAELFCRQQTFTSIGYFCKSDQLGFFLCIDDYSQSAQFACPMGTKCTCDVGVECSNQGDQSPCTNGNKQELDESEPSGNSSSASLAAPLLIFTFVSFWLAL
eukprot:TRINITY_DN575_c0_g1_i1.p1 TRINITY_DN575_c0_g1~~TRINITY_DN575_c0_g1_i1.p1  ORF type:complete len:533 (-),score=155.30 TRINITY_DN575_c0_g1_i1:40-1638(-)